LRHRLIAAKVPIQAAPGIEAPVHAAQYARALTTKLGPTSRIQASSLDSSTTRTAAGSAARARGVLLRRGADAHRLEPGDRRGDRGKGPLGRQRTLPPVVGPLRPQHPACIVRLEFGRHPEAVARRR
jgi:hypothetical protein